jgi:hypothetical protein
MHSVTIVVYGYFIADVRWGNDNIPFCSFDRFPETS